MAKRSMRSKSRDSSYAAPENVHPLCPGRPGHQAKGWTPHDPDGQFRDRKYVKNVRAMSPAQQQKVRDFMQRRHGWFNRG